MKSTPSVDPRKPSLDGPVRVLLVEDNPAHVHLVEAALARSRHGPIDVVAAGTLADALARIAEDGIDLVLLDLSLPDSSGLATALYVLEEAEGIPVIVLSGSDDDEIAMEAVAAGAEDYQIKGQLDLELLPRSIRYALERHRLKSELARLAVVDDLSVSQAGGYAQVAVSSRGTLAYVTESLARPASELVWFDREGQAAPATNQLRRYLNVRLSPDEQSAALTIQGESQDLGRRAPDASRIRGSRGLL